MKPSVLVVLCFASLLAVGPAALRGQSTARASVTSAEAQVVGGHSEAPSLSHTGRFVAFYSQAPGLVPDDASTTLDVFVRDTALGTTERVSLSTAGVAGNGPSDFPSISADGRFVAFRSSALNLDPADTTVLQDIYVHDRLAGTTTVVSKDSFGIVFPSGHSSYPSISADGVYVAFESESIKLVSDDSNAKTDIFVHNRLTGVTSRVSLMNVPPPFPNVNQATGHCYKASISGDGRFVVFASVAFNLVTGDTNSKGDIFLRDRLLATTTLISKSTAGVQGDGHADNPFISADGTLIAFESTATNLVAGDTNGFTDVFVHHRLTGVTERVSVSTAGAQGNLFSAEAALSSDGRYVAFQSSATNLAPGDTNAEADAFVRDLQTGTTTRVSLATVGTQGNKGSRVPAISGDGRITAWDSESSTLVPGDTNNRSDVFVADPAGCAAGGAWSAYGTGLSGAGGHVPALYGESCPLPGALVTLHLDGIVGGAPGAIFVGLTSAAVPFKGGTFHVGGLILSLGLAVGGTPGLAGAGELVLPALLPNDPLLTGLSIFLQGAFSDGAAVQNVSLTQGLQMTFG